LALKSLLHRDGNLLNQH